MVKMPITAEELAPTQERRSHGYIERFDKAIADEQDRPSQPYHVIDFLIRLESKGIITAEMRQAGDDFRFTFRAAQFENLRAADMSRPIVSGSRSPELPHSAERARRRINETMLALGGRSSYAGSCIWDVLGLERSLREWRIHHGFAINPHAATGILIAALSVIAAKK